MTMVRTTLDKKFLFGKIEVFQDEETFRILFTDQRDLTALRAALQAGERSIEIKKGNLK